MDLQFSDEGCTAEILARTLESIDYKQSCRPHFTQTLMTHVQPE